MWGGGRLIQAPYNGAQVIPAADVQKSRTNDSKGLKAEIRSSTANQISYQLYLHDFGIPGRITSI